MSFSGGNAGISSHPGQGGLYTSGGPGSNNSHQVRHEESIGNLQHISEREPDDWEEDPSLHRTTETLFLEKSKQSKAKTYKNQEQPYKIIIQSFMFTVLSHF